MTRQTPLTYERPTSALSLLGVVEQLKQAGCAVDLPEVRKAAKFAEVEAGYITTARELRDEGAANNNGAVERLAGEVHAGRLDTGALVAEVTRLRELGDRHSRVFATLERAQRLAGQEAATVLARVGDRWITDVLRPVFAPVLDRAVEIAGRIPEWVVDDLDAESHRSTRELRDDWRQLGDLLVDLDALWSLAESLRMFRLVPTAGSPYPEDVRWLHLDRLTDASSRAPQRWFLVNVRRGAEPGMFTDAEQTDTTAA